MAQVFLVPDPARRADRQGRLVDLPCAAGAVRSLGVAGPIGPRNGPTVNLAPVPMTLVRFASLGRFLGGLRPGLISLLVLVQLLELALVEAEQDVRVVLAGLGPEIAQVGPQHLNGPRSSDQNASQARSSTASPITSRSSR